MSNKRILIIGNHTCGNRGDAAIMRGLLRILEELVPDCRIDVTSRYPTSSSFLMGRPIIPDLFHGNRLVSRGPGESRRRRLIPWLLLLNSRADGHRYRHLLPQTVKTRIERFREYDLVLQVGGSNFVDLYGYSHFEAAFAAMAADRPVILLGHSIGPIARGRYPVFVKHLLTHAHYVGVRETLSRDILAEAGMPLDRVDVGADTAWAVTPPAAPTTVVKDRYFDGDSRSVVAVTFRALAPFDKRLGTTQQAYEQAFAALISELVADGYNVLALSTCTGIESYHRDDRMVALRIGDQVDAPGRYRVVMDELNDLEIGALLAQCELLIGTRLHSAIIALNFGTPALAISYEHKSKGTFKDMGLECLSADMEELLDESLLCRARSLLENIDSIRETIAEPVSTARAKTRTMIERGLNAAM